MHITIPFVAYILAFFFFKPAPGHDHPFADGSDHQAVTVCVTCLFQHAADVGPHRGFSHVEFYGNLGICFSLTEKTQGLYFTVGQFAGKRIAEPYTRRTVRPEALTGKSAVNYIHKVA